MFKRDRFLITFAFLSAIAVNVAWDKYQQHTKESAPATDWFVVWGLSVADGEQGNSKLPVVYNREIRKSFSGRWHAEIKNTETQETVCWGNGDAFYEPKDILPKAGVDLEWIVGKDCDLKPSQYYLEINYLISPINYPIKSYRAVSNVFTISEGHNG